MFIVTGAARGLGEVISRRLWSQGANVMLVDLDPAVHGVASELGERASAADFDVANPSSWLSALGREGIHRKAISGLVCCAGILGRQGLVIDEPLDDWQHVLEVNLTGVFVSNQAVLPEMIAAGYGRIVNIASIAGKEGNPGQAAYSASKAGVITLTKTIAKEVARQGITVNCIAPTMVRGPFAESMTADSRDSLLKKIPMGRFAESEEVAAMVAWICSDECSFTTGACFDLSGGRATY